MVFQQAAGNLKTLLKGCREGTSERVAPFLEDSALIETHTEVNHAIRKIHLYMFIVYYSVLTAFPSYKPHLLTAKTHSHIHTYLKTFRALYLHSDKKKNY